MPSPSVNVIKSSFSFLLYFFIPFIVAMVLSYAPIFHHCCAS
jgi:hypothetical protein